MAVVQVWLLCGLSWSSSPLLSTSLLCIFRCLNDNYIHIIFTIHSEQTFVNANWLLTLCKRNLRTVSTARPSLPFWNQPCCCLISGKIIVANRIWLRIFKDFTDVVNISIKNERKVIKNKRYYFLIAHCMLWAFPFTALTLFQILTLNPSTDLLVTAQYAPVSEISYQPPAVSEEEETRKLMGSDNKEW